MKLDKATLEEYGLLLLKIKMFPYFDIAHYILTCLAVRDDIHTYQPNLPNFHKRHILSCYLSSMLMCFGGGMIVHFILGEPILDDFKHHQNLVLASACWYLVFFSPFDLFYKLVKFLPIKIALSACKEVQRARKVYDGVNHAMHVYPTSYIIIILAGTLKGCGGAFLAVIERFNRGIFASGTNEALHPSFASKASFVASILFTLERKSLLGTVPRNILFLGVAAFFAYVKLMSIFFKSFDPFIPFENLTSALFFGGIIDALRKAKKPSPAKAKEANSELSKTSPVDSEAKKTN